MKVIIIGSVIQIGNIFEVNARLVSVEDGSILRAERIRGNGLEAVERMMDSLTESMKRDFPLEGYIVMVSGKRVMIDLGRTHGVEPGMRFFAQRKGAAVRHPVSGKMLAGEETHIGELAVQTVERESSWADILDEAPGMKILAGNLVRQALGERVPAPAPRPAAPAAAAPAPPAAAAAPAPADGTMQKTAFPGRFGRKILVDWPGRNDLLLGDRDGFVTLYRNTGTADAPQYDAGIRLLAGGKEIKVKGRSAPYLVDWNGDGKMDLLVGNGAGYLQLFLNEGNNVFAPGVMIKAGGKDLDVGSNASPCVVDWNEDGKKDLAMGKGNGTIYVFLNEGNSEQPVFGKPIELNNGRLDVGSNSSPDVADWNGDGKKDLIIGNDDGEIFVFLNEGTNAEPKFKNSGTKLSLKLGQDISPQGLSRARGIHDLVAADRYGEATYCANTGTPMNPNFPEKKILRAGKK